MSKGILLDSNDDLQIHVKRDANGLIIQGLVIGETKLQDAHMVLKMNQGELKEDPIMGTNLLRVIRSKADKEKLKKIIKIGLKRANIEFEDIKNELQALYEQTTV